MHELHNFINGHPVRSSQQIELTDPRTGKVQGRLSLADTAITHAAIDAADNAFSAWANTPAPERAKVLFNFRELMCRHTDELAQLVHQEHGKSKLEAKQSIARGIENIEYACQAPSLLQGQYSENVAHDVDCYSLRQPLGVCLGISPFNFPVMVPVWCFAQAIACGNTVVLKPSPHDPSCSIRMAELLLEAGLPAGVLNVIHGNAEVVEQCIADPRIKAVTAVASTPVAKAIYQQAIAQGKRAQTFGGAKNHAVVMSDANMDLAAKQICQAAYGSAGERCMALSAAVLVGDDTAERFIAALTQHTDALTVGVNDHDIGPLISQQHQQRVLQFIDQGVAEGAELIFDGRQVKVEGYEQGFYCGPCCFDHVKPTMQIYQQEIFGPVLSLIRVHDFRSALSLVNQHQYGNGTAIFTNNGKLAREYAKQVQVGMVGINVPVPVPVSYHRFGGWKDSFFGDIEMHANQSVQFYTHGKSVTVAWPDGGDPS